MLKKYWVLAFVYAGVAMALGVFYREYTKALGFDGETTLSVMHTHYFVLGMFFFLILMLLEKSFRLSEQRLMGPFLWIYNIGLNITGAGLFSRGLADVSNAAISKGLDASISGVSGIGHILLGTGIVLMLVALGRQLRIPESKG